jgi:hypothetical protein
LKWNYNDFIVEIRFVLGIIIIDNAFDIPPPVKTVIQKIVSFFSTLPLKTLPHPTGRVWVLNARGRV